MENETPMHLVIFLIALFPSNTNSQRSFLQCDKINNQRIINNTFLSFENDVFGYYKLEIDTAREYKNNLSEISNKIIDLNAMTSEESIKIAYNFMCNAKTDKAIGISYYNDYKNHLTEEKKNLITSKLDQKLTLNR